MKRREFIQLLGGAAAWPVAARAQPKATPVVGFLGPATAATSRPRIEVFSRRLHELGWTEGRTVRVDYRWADGRADRFTEIATQFVQAKVDVIATWGTATVAAARRATADIPIVFALVADPVGTGLVSSLARPGGNVTGLSTQHVEATGKRLELLREFVPSLKRLGIMTNISNLASVIELREVQHSAAALDLQTVSVEVRAAEDIASAFAKLESRADALFVVPEQLFNTNRQRLNELALSARLPSMHGFREAVEAGGLMSYGPDYLDMFRRTADFVDRILRGARPADIPVEQPTKFELVINLRTAKAIGLTVPPLLLARADDVIE